MARNRGDGTGAGSTRSIDTTYEAVPLLGRHSPRLARLRDVARRGDPARTAADGLKLVAELARRGVPIEEVFVAEDALPAVLAEPALAAVARRGRMVRVDADALERVAPTRTSQGVLAVVPVRPVLVPTAGVVLYLDRVQDPGNVGAVIRAAAALGATGVACSPGCADPYSPRVLRSSAGWAL
ncbi:MAG: TrmH family RNA methyltransferase, partial [Acidobacteriota bacterium]